MNFNSPHPRRSLSRSIATIIAGLAFAASVPAFAQQTVTPGNTINPSGQDIVVTGTDNTVNANNQVMASGDNNTVDAQSPLTILNGFGSSVMFTGTNTMPPGISNPNNSGGDNVLIGNHSNLNGTTSVLVGDSGNLTGENNTGAGAGLYIFANNATCLGSYTQCGTNQPNVTIDPNVVGGQTAAGYGAQAISSQSSVFGANGSATAQFAMSLGYGGFAGYYNCIAMQSTCDRANSVSFGNRQLTQLQYGVQQYDGVAVGQLYTMANAFGGGANFNNGQFNTPSYLLSGGLFTDVGSALTYLDNRITNLPTGGTTTPPPVSSTDPGAVHYDNSSKNTVTLQGSNGTKVTNLAPGEVSATSSDAVNGSQLYATNQQVAQNTQNITTNTTNIKTLQDNALQYDPSTQTYNATRDSMPTRISGVAPGINPTDAVNVGQMDAAIGGVKDWAKSYTDQRFNQLNNKFNALGAQSQAMSNAAASFAGVDSNKKNLFAVGIGVQGGRVANAIMYQHRNENGYSAWNASVSFTQGSGTSLGVGYAIGW